MNKVLFTAMLCLYSMAVLAQEESKPAVEISNEIVLDTAFYDDDERISTKDKCAYYVTWDDKKGRWNSLNRFYYANDSLKKEGSYEKSSKVGVWKEWYANGQPKSVEYYEEDPDKRKAFPDMQQYWTEDGKQLVVDGNGYFIEIYEDRKSEGAYVNGRMDGEWLIYHKDTLRHKEVWDGEAVKGWTYLRDREKPEYNNLDSLSYDTLGINAEPTGGLEAFYRYIATNLEYPKKAKRMGVQGRVIMQFIVDEEGKVINVEIIRGIGAGCDEEAVRVLQGSPRWKPAIHRGRRVKQRMTFPISYKLN